QVSLLGILADYAAIAIANARLFAALENRAKNIERAYEELKSRDALRERTLNGIIGIRQPLLDLQNDLKQLVYKSGTLPRPLVTGLSAVGEKVKNLLAAVDQLAKLK